MSSTSAAGNSNVTKPRSISIESPTAWAARTCALPPTWSAITTPATAILEEAGNQGDCLIALQTHGGGGLPRLWLGSVADKVIRAATSPVLIARPAQVNNQCPGAR